MEPILRLARLDEADAIDDLMKASTRDIFPTVYTAEQTASAMKYVASVDRTLLQDGTYFVFETGGELVACGGWSKRAKLYSGSGEGEGDDRLLDPATEAAHVRAMFTRSDWTRRGLGRRILAACEAAARAAGFRHLTLGATLPGLPLYEAFGFRETGRGDVVMPDGVPLACVWMDKPMEEPDPNIDDALLTAAERARQAHERLVETPPEDPAIVPKAQEVHQRAEEVDELAEDAVEDAEKGQE